jgi:hypothetical protein
MKAPSQTIIPRGIELDVADFTQQIDAPFDDLRRRDEPTLSKLDFDELDLKLEF